MYSTETVKAFINRCQRRLDQETDPESNMWSIAEMLEYTNEGMREVWQAVRETHQNWYVRTITSTDPKQFIGGKEYDPDLLRLTLRREKLFLPSDFRELLFLEALPPTSAEQTGDYFFPTARFEYRNLTQRAFRDDALNTITQGVRNYCYDVVYAPDGPYIIFSPQLSMTEDLRCQIKYLAAPAPLYVTSSFEHSGYTLEMVDAILAYVCYAAAQKEGVDMNVARLFSIWGTKRELAVRSAGPKQTRDEEPVEGYLEDEL